MRVFVSHSSSKDKAAVKALAQVLRARGIDRSGLTETQPKVCIVANTGITGLRTIQIVLR